LLDKTLNLFCFLLQTSSLQVATLVKDEEKQKKIIEKIELLGIVPGNNSLIGIHFPFWVKFWGGGELTDQQK